jgi:hypothetical protein
MQTMLVFSAFDMGHYVSSKRKEALKQRHVSDGLNPQQTLCVNFKHYKLGTVAFPICILFLFVLWWFYIVLRCVYVCVGV